MAKPATTRQEAPSIGFAVNWNPDPRTTWSGTAWNLWQAMLATGKSPDVGVHLSPIQRKALQLASVRRRAGAWIPTWEHTRLWQRTLQRLIAQNVAAEVCDAVLEIQDIAVLDTPFYIYSDLSYDLLAQELDRPGSAVRQFFRTLDPGTFARRRARQRRVYERAGGIFAMSEWFRSSLIDLSGIDPAKVHVARPGVVMDRPPPVEPRERPRMRLLFVGTTFLVKGGDLVLEAVRRIRLTDPDVSLTIAGPRNWPMPGSIPSGVTFLGRRSHAQVQDLYRSHDLLVMPSRLEGFGLVFLEAQASGLPCVGRRAFAMPELIEDGATGALIDSDDPDELVETIQRTLADDHIYSTTAQRARALMADFSWNRTATTVRTIVERDLAQPE